MVRKALAFRLARRDLMIGRNPFNHQRKTWGQIVTGLVRLRKVKVAPIHVCLAIVVKLLPVQADIEYVKNEQSHAGYHYEDTWRDPVPSGYKRIWRHPPLGKRGFPN